MRWMIVPLRRYFDFQGRSRRLEYWMFVLFAFLLFAATAALDGVLPTGGGTVASVTSAPGFWSYSTATGVGWITRTAAIAMLPPSLAVAVRRLHDVGWRGWWLLLTFVPLAGAIVLLVFFLTDGERGPNRFGPDPKQSDIGPVADPSALG